MVNPLYSSTKPIFLLFQKPMRMKRLCKICENRLTGRGDKIFCNISCKNEYHRQMREFARTQGARINSFLERNYILLHEVLGSKKGQVKVDRNILAKKKFRFKYHTHYHINSRNKTYYYIYDLGWMEFSDDEILIVRKS